jgi:hypothetical protein
MVPTQGDPRVRVWGITSRFGYGNLGTRFSRLTVTNDWLKIGRVIGDDIELRRTGGLVRFQAFRLPLKWFTDITFVNNGETERVHFRTFRARKLSNELQVRQWKTEVLPAVTLVSLGKRVFRKLR